MQFAISDVAATVFAHEFYTATADGYALEAALTEARKAMFTQQLGVEWATPVLSTRTDATHLFDRPTSNPAAAAPTRAVNQQSQNAAPTLPARQRAAMRGMALVAGGIVTLLVYLYVPAPGGRCPSA